jgi:hypothetical protein
VIEAVCVRLPLVPVTVAVPVKVPSNPLLLGPMVSVVDCPGATPVVGDTEHVVPERADDIEQLKLALAVNPSRENTVTCVDAELSKFAFSVGLVGRR